MGWSGGTEIGEKLIKSLRKNVPDKKSRAKIYKDMIDALTDQDWDNIDECFGIDEVFDKVYHKMYPNPEY